MTNIEILQKIFEPTGIDCQSEKHDLQIQITLNPDLDMILEAMEIAYNEGFKKGCANTRA